MGSSFAKLLAEKHLKCDHSSTKQESTGMLQDVSLDESHFLEEGGDVLHDPMTPPNILKIKCDPRSPSNFDRTPLKISRDVTE